MWKGARMNPIYTNQELYQIGKDNYQTLVCHCLILQTEGYWTEPKKLLKQSILEHLNLYVQSLLFVYGEYSEDISEEMIKYIRETPHDNLLGVEEFTKEKVEYQAGETAKKFLAAPPILLQLFSYHDEKKETNLTALFFDTLLNIILAMAHLNEKKGQKVSQFIRNYYGEIGCFLSKDMCYLGEVDDRYLFRMTCLQSFQKGYNYVEKDYLRRNQAKEQIKENENEEEIQKANENQKTAFLKQSTTKSEKGEIAEKPKALSEEEVAKAIKQAKQEMEAVKEAKRAAVLDGLLERLNNLVGLAPVKKEMQSLVNVIKVRKMREQHHLPQMDMSYHMVFIGNPGTGKTTVARLVAEIYKELGVLSKGTLVETDRSGLVAGFIGQTAIKVTEVVEKAKGGVLFIDEAYALASRDATDDYGSEAIETLVKQMEDNRNDLVVIVAGYKEEMDRFLKSNTGLVSRFNKFIDFEDYNNEELVAILKVMAADAAMEISKEALGYLHERLSKMTESEKSAFGNARGIRNVFETLVTNQANRIVFINNPTVEQLSEIVLSDVDGVLE